MRTFILPILKWLICRTRLKNLLHRYFLSLDFLKDIFLLQTRHYVISIMSLDGWRTTPDYKEITQTKLRNIRVGRQSDGFLNNHWRFWGFVRPNRSMVFSPPCPPHTHSPSLSWPQFSSLEVGSFSDCKGGTRRVRFFYFQETWWYFVETIRSFTIKKLIFNRGSTYFLIQAFPVIIKENFSEISSLLTI